MCVLAVCYNQSGTFWHPQSATSFEARVVGCLSHHVSEVGCIRQGIRHVHSLLGGVIEAVDDVPYEQNGAHESEHLAVEAERRQEGQEQHVQYLPELVGHLRSPPGNMRYARRSSRNWDVFLADRALFMHKDWTYQTPHP